jgi:hypothetical protein
MTPAMPQILYEIITMIASFIRLVGMAAVGVGMGYLALELLHKSQDWRFHMAFFLGLAGLLIAMVVFLAPGALGGFGIGFGVAIFIWGLPKKKKEKED